jgi:aerobic C4-dicarboxylate transport protein
VTLTASLQAFGGTFFTADAIAVGIALVVGIDRIMSEGRALTNAIGNTVATLVIARWQGELDEDRLHRVLADPESIDALVERRLRGEDQDERHEGDGRGDGRFTREGELALPGP